MIKLPELTDRDRRTIRYAAMGLSAYLVLFGGWKALQILGAQRTTYLDLRRQADEQRARVDLYSSRVVRLHRLMDAAQLDPAQISKPKLVGRASTAIQQAATQGGLQMGAIRETLARGSDRELGAIQLEASGQVTSLTTFLHRLGSLGYPIILDTVEFTSDPMRPGMLKISVSLILLDYDQWDSREVPHA